MLEDILADLFVNLTFVYYKEIIVIVKKKKCQQQIVLSTTYNQIVLSTTYNHFFPDLEFRRNFVLYFTSIFAFLVGRAPSAQYAQTTCRTLTRA